MTKLFKKIVSALVTAQMALALVPAVSVSAASELKQIDDWKIYFNGGAKGEAYIDSENAYSGSSSLKITQTTASAANLYINAQRAVTVEAGKTYKIGAKVKSLRSTTLQFVVSWDKRRDVAPFGGTFDWTNYEFEFVPAATGTETLMLIIDGVSDGIWLDDVYFTDVETGKNLITDGTFETDDDGAAADIGESAVDPEITKIYNNVLTSDSFSATDMERVIGGFKYMPVYRADGIKIDGKGDDWAEYTPGSMPTLPTQYQVYISDERAKDVSATWKFAQDDDNLYLYIEVTDDVFYYSAGGKDYYWRGDSIQFALSSTDESYGTEFGLAHNPQTGEGEVFSSSLSDAELASINLKTSVSGNKTVYEVAIPWKIKFNSRPQEFLFDFLVNDNDGDGRRYCLELAPGISEGKTNAVFPRMEIIDGNDDWYAWAQGETTAYSHNENELTYFLVNKGGAKTFEITYADGNTETVDIPAESGIRRVYKYTFDEPTDENVVTSFKTAGSEKNITTQIKVKDKPATKAEHEALMELNTKHVREIKRLLKQCGEKGIATDDENVNYQVMVLFEDYLQEYLDEGWFDNTYYCERTLNELYTEAKENLTAYLEGSKTPKPSAPVYVTSETTFSGGSAYAFAEVDGKLEYRPMTFVGYCLFARNKDDIYELRKRKKRKYLCGRSACHIGS